MSISSIGSVSSLMTSMLNRSSQSGTSQKMDFSELATKIISKEDKDGDGLISSAESRLQSSQFQEADSDSNGTLTAEELASHLQTRKPPQGGPQGPPPGPPPGGMDTSSMVSGILEREDTNKDGVLSADESRASSEIFSAIDTDEDGSLTVEELTSHFESLRSENEESALGTVEMDLQTFLDLLSRKEASSAYSQQGWQYELLGDSTDSLMVSA